MSAGKLHWSLILLFDVPQNIMNMIRRDFIGEVPSEREEKSHEKVLVRLVTGLLIRIKTNSRGSRRQMQPLSPLIPRHHFRAALDVNTSGTLRSARAGPRLSKFMASSVDVTPTRGRPSGFQPYLDARARPL